MKMYLGDLVSRRKPAIEAFLKKPYSGKITLKLVKFQKEIEKIFQVYEETRNKLITKYGTEKDGQIKVEKDTEGWFNFIAEINEVYAEEIEVPELDLIIEDLCTDDIKISAEEITLLEDFLKKVENPN